jgi:uncharacterized phiE125 gp8 family phage protein
MPLGSNALTTLEAVKSYLKIDSSQTVDDSRLEDLINACSSAIENYCERKLKEQTFTDDEYDGNGSRYILLRAYPVKSIASVSINGTLLDVSQYKVRKNDGTLIRTGTTTQFIGYDYYQRGPVWPKGDINISVTYTAGLSEIPADLELACRYFVMAFFKADVAAFSTTFSEGFVFRADAMPSQVKMLLQPYKKVV